MTWHKDKALQRIRDLKKKFPETLSEDLMLQSHRSLNEIEFTAYDRARTFGEAPTFLKNLGADQSRIVDGVHVYAKLLDYDDTLFEQRRETEQSHKRLLAFLNLHYASADRVIQDMGAIRVDYHGGRLHAVVVAPFDNEQGRLIAAIQLCRLLQIVATDAVEKFGEHGMGSRLRFGIDSGKSVAIGNASIKLQGTDRTENDPLFLGSAANEAAKLAEGKDAGIFLTARAWHKLNRTVQGLLSPRNFELIKEGFDFHEADRIASSRRDVIMKKWDTEMLTRSFDKSGAANFVFHQHTPPMSSIQFAKLLPSNSIRMDLCSIFADLDGYTSYVDNCIANGSVREAVRNIQIIRSEFGLVLRSDFGGKKIRFIGDCIQGMIASGTSQGINSNDTVRQALLCSGGLRSSFELCQEELPSTQQLGLAIGIEFGTAPISRIGIRGEQSVRVASAKVVAASEEAQQRCSGTETAIGESAFNLLPLDAKPKFHNDKLASAGLTYAIALSLISVAMPNIVSANEKNDTQDTVQSEETKPPTRSTGSHCK